ncbi:MAG: lipase maturation factor family protein [Elusimicrobia bacterium]|nr:lipase maturation factor family protein [Elusimicrobiota bacterium]
MLYDGDCGFCRWWVERFHRLAPGAFDIAPLAGAPRRPPGLSPEAYAGSIHYQAPGGEWASAARAAFEAASLAPGRGYLRRVYPLVAPAAEAAYRLVARRRGPAAFLSRLVFGADPEPPRYALTRWGVWRGLALVSALAFASLWLQLDGLIGSGGILPAGRLLAAAKAELGARAYWEFPSVAWLASGDRALHAGCAAGVGVSVAAFFGAFMGPSLLAAWALYLSFGSISQEFLGYQWDILLLELLLLGAVWAPWSPRSRFEREARPAAAGLWLMRWLLFRLMFESGLVKLASGDPSWRAFTALSFHYETQPLPTWLAWYAHQLPVAAHRASVGVMFAVELAAPWLLWLPRRPRVAAFFALTSLQGLIALTGNYTFFNLATLLLCLTALDDALLRRVLPASVAAGLKEPPSRPEPPRAARWARGLLAAAIAVLGLAPLLRMAFGAAPAPLMAAYRAVSPLRSVNGYGLFAVMTTKRMEISVEGSRDGVEWREYVFPYKPGDPLSRPRFVAPHQPRLDWQMWFAALGTCEQNRWFVMFLSRLFEGSAPVRALLANDPFPDEPPRYLRTRFYEYRFTTREQARLGGAWWRRELVGDYCPPLERRLGP